MREDQNLVPPNGGFRADIQGLRAVAVSMVVLFHSGVAVFSGGYAGVDVFFVISGFLITGQLLDLVGRPGRVSFAEFYAKRIRRIVPASFVVLALTALSAVLFIPPLDLSRVLKDAAATASYVPNIFFAVQGTDYLAETSPSPFQHYWSLGVEEQFYLFWPVFLAVAYAVSRKRPKRLLGILASASLLSFVLCLVLVQKSQPWAFFSLPTRAWELGVGGIVAMALANNLINIPRRVSQVIGAVGLSGILASCLMLNAETVFPGAATLLPVLSTAAVIVAGRREHFSPLARFFSLRVTQVMGKLSYSIYLVHWPLLVIPQASVGYENKLPLYVTLLIGLASVPIAILLNRYVEEPFRHKSKGRALRPWKTLGLTAAASLVIVGTAASANAFQNLAPIASTQLASASPPVQDPSGTPFVPANMTPTLREAALDNPKTYADGCHADFERTSAQTECVYGDRDSQRKVVLFGDSHAAQWFPALEDFALKNSLSLYNFTKSSCPSATIDVQRNNLDYIACNEWRANVINSIEGLKPEIVVISNFGEITPTVESDAVAAQWEKGLRETILLMPAETRTYVLADTPRHDFSPLSCLSRHTTSADTCSLSKESGTDIEVAEAEARAASASGAEFVDLTGFLCSRTCPGIIGNVLVYRDAHHMTETFSRSLSSPLAAALALRT